MSNLCYYFNFSWTTIENSDDESMNTEEVKHISNSIFRSKTLLQMLKVSFWSIWKNGPSEGDVGTNQILVHQGFFTFFINFIFILAKQFGFYLPSEGDVGTNQILVHWGILDFFPNFIFIQAKWFGFYYYIFKLTVENLLIFTLNFHVSNFIGKTILR